MKLIIINIFIAYAALLLFAYFVSDHMIFLPPRAGYQNSPELIKLLTADGEKICAYYLPNKNAKYTLLISHGNAEDIGYMLPFLIEMRTHGFSVFAYDYHGYGLSGGKPTERNTYLDIDAAYDHLTKDLHIAPERIISYGHSVGAAVALDLAIRKSVAGVILQGAFVTAFRVMTQIPIIPFDKYNKIKLLKSPLLMIHGNIDTVIPIWHGKNLYHAAPLPKEFYLVKNAGHNDILMVAGEEYWRTIASFIEQNITKK
jgi:pimeloyl-ACP methyl ester carboxylesterase